MKNGPQITRETLVTRTYLDDVRGNRPLSVPLVMGTVFTAPTSEEHGRLFRAKDPEFYLRFGHPMSVSLADKIAALEGTETALSFSSGMAAISTTLISMVRSGDHAIVVGDVFEQTEAVLQYFEANFGLRLEFVGVNEFDTVSAATNRETRFVYTETPSNPVTAISDISELSEIARSFGVPLVVDNTFATPWLQRPVEHGADIVLHSGTKFLNGHMDVMCGFVAGTKEALAPVYELQRLLGGVLDPHAAWLVHRGLKTLGVRMERINATAIELAEWLGQHDGVEKVHYPFLTSNPGYAIARKQMSGGGGIVSFVLNGAAERAREFLNRLKLIHIASSLGGVETTIELPYDLDWVDRVDGKAGGKASLPVERGLIRMSVGLESVDDLVRDLEEALEAR